MLAYSGHGRFVVQAISLSRLIEDMSPVLESIVGEHVAISYRLTPDLPPTHADATQLRQVIVNLVSNASDAIGAKDGLVSISTGAVQLDRRYLNDTFLDDDLPEGLYVYVDVSDTGVGMDLQTKKRIFDPFFSTKFAGRGLGLAAVLGIVRGHHGALKVYSEPGKGSTFKVLLPYADAPVESAPPQPFGVGAWRGSGVILVVDDEEAVRTVARRILERFGFEVITAADGQEGVDVFQQHADRIVAVLLDVTMPVMDGEQAYRELRLIKPDVRVVLSSGFSEQDATTRFAGKGLAGFIQKPYRATALVELLQSVLESAPETQE
jgi:CheY-like chemotaxis protein